MAKKLYSFWSALKITLKTQHACCWGLNKH
jgi:hypothetical protein